MIYIKNVLDLKINDDLSINCKDVECLCIGFLFENKRNTLINVLYRSPNGQTESFEKFKKNVFSITKNSNKTNKKHTRLQEIFFLNNIYLIFQFSKVRY